MKLYIENPVTTDLKSFLEDYFTREQPATYYKDNPLGLVQTNEYRRRSFGDLYALVTTYFPEATEKDLAKILIEFCKKDFICGDYCTGINRAVFYIFRENYVQFWMHPGKEYKIGNDGYSHEIIEQLATT